LTLNGEVSVEQVSALSNIRYVAVKAKRLWKRDTFLFIYRVLSLTRDVFVHCDASTHPHTTHHTLRVLTRAILKTHGTLHLILTTDFVCFDEIFFKYKQRLSLRGGD
jgi:hypothetical protein